jgi:DNA/RNA endonuclease YhcR with UshA esterase domain
MRETRLRNLALLCSILGLIVLFYASQNIQAEHININAIIVDDIGNTVKICGEITYKRVSNNHVFFDIKDSTGTIDVVIFNTTAMGLKNKGTDVYDFKQGESICLVGAVSEYPKGSGQLELIYRTGEIKRI